MHWIEELFGLDPDGGTGVTEFLILVALSLTIVVVGTTLLLRRHGTRSAVRRWLGRY